MSEGAGEEVIAYRGQRKAIHVPSKGMLLTDTHQCNLPKRLPQEIDLGIRESQINKNSSTEGRGKRVERPRPSLKKQRIKNS